MTYKVTLNLSDISFSVGPEETILESALRQDLSLPYSCKTGKCDTCIALSINKNGESEEIKTCITKPSEDIALEVELLTELEGIKTNTLPCRIDKLEYLSKDVIALVLRTPPNQPTQHLAGQYIDLIKGEIRRSYSISSSPSSNKIELQIQRVKGGKFSEYLFETAQRNDLLYLEGPFGTFFRRRKSIDSQKPTIFIAGGTGFAPVQSMVRWLIENNDKSSVYVYWGNNQPSGFYTELPQQWANEYPSIHYVPVVSKLDEKIVWEGRTGFVHEAILEDFPDLRGYDVFACGNPDMIQAAKNSFEQAGLASNSFYADAFIPSV